MKTTNHMTGFFSYDEDTDTLVNFGPVRWLGIYEVLIVFAIFYIYQNPLKLLYRILIIISCKWAGGNKPSPVYYSTHRIERLIYLLTDILAILASGEHL